MHKHVVVLLVIATNGCFVSEPDKTKPECQSNDNCRAEFACVDNRCAAPCTTQGDCDASTVCFAGYCVGRTAGSTPSVDSISGNGVGTPMQVKDGFLLTGTQLANAEFELAGDGWAVPLTAAKRTSTAAEVVWSKTALASLPVGTSRGSYELVATNRSGSSLTSVSLLLPDYTGDELVSRINTQATTAFTNSAMPADLLNRIAALEALIVNSVDKTGAVFAGYFTDASYTLDDTHRELIVNFASKARDTDDAVTVADAAGGTWHFTVPPGKGGLYHIGTQITFINGNSDVVDVGLETRINGSDGVRMWRSTANYGYTAASGSIEREVAAGDTISVVLWINSSQTITTENAWVQIRRVLGY